MVATRRIPRPGNARTPQAPPLPGASACVFLDLDGTLLDFAATPDEVRVDRGFFELRRAAQVRPDGALALISGQSTGDLDGPFVPRGAAGRRNPWRETPRGAWCLPHQSPSPDALNEARATLRAFLQIESD
ncbi:MAG TPA: hypothetical protein VFX76_00620 [Roseiflexaceae bacterium]|nr:hypothetical protein [Roseiflexaceae bacterium]